MRVLWFICVLFQAGNLLALSGERPPEVDDAPLRVRRAPQQGYLVEMVVVVDQNEAAKFQNDRAAIEANVRALLGYVNRFYSTFNLEVSLLRLEILTRDDGVYNPYSGDDTLRKFISYVLKMKKETADNSDWNRADNFQLLLGDDFQLQGSLKLGGYGAMGSMCTSASAALVVDPDHFDHWQTSTTIAHELGHNLGLHDISRTDCNRCEACVMRDISVWGTTMSPWTTCSKSALHSYLPKYKCLQRVSGSREENQQRETERKREQEENENKMKQEREATLRREQEKKEQDRIREKERKAREYEKEEDKKDREYQEYLKRFYAKHGMTAPTASRTKEITHRATTPVPATGRHEKGSCIDRNGSITCKSWKKAGYCSNNEFTQNNCQLTCGLCGGNTDGSSPTTTGSKEGLCIDNFAHFNTCEGWKRAGYCVNSKITRTNCQLTCGFCEGNTDGSSQPNARKPRVPTTTGNTESHCTDILDQLTCESWKHAGSCSKSKYTRTKCQLTCGLCGRK